MKMTVRNYILLVAALLMSAVTFAASPMNNINYLHYKSLEGIEQTHYVFLYDDQGTPWLIQVINDDIDSSPRKKASGEFIRSLHELIAQGDVFSYAPEYYAEPEVCGGTKWELEVRLNNGQSVRSSGRAVFPPNSILDSLELLLKSYLHQR
jgi:hypothetical protein